jgi:peptidoglycan hydrolase-like protein with peptidoglycan-binding domain
MMWSVGGRSLGSSSARVRCSAAVLGAALMVLAGCGSSAKPKTTKATTTTLSRTAATTTTLPSSALSTATSTTLAPAPITSVTSAVTPTTVGYTPEPATGALKKGYSGTRVAALQTKLKALGYDPGPADGKFGDKTVAAVKKFQTDKNLTVDGIAGNQTLTALDAACKNKC